MGMRNTWKKESHEDKGVRRALYSEDPNDPHTYQGVFSTNLKKKLKIAYDKWEKAGKPGGAFRILDLGSGRGRAIKQMKKELDSPEDTVFIHHNLFVEDFGSKKKGKRTIAEATELPFKDDSFHFVVSACAIPYVRDKLKAVREAHRVLHPLGWAALHIRSGIRKEQVKENGKTVNLSEWLQKHGLKHERKSVPWGASSFSFGKGIELPETRVASSKEEKIIPNIFSSFEGLGITIPPHHLISTYEVIK